MCCRRIGYSEGYFPDTVQHEKRPLARMLLRCNLLFKGIWLRGQDLNLRPSGYEPDELPGCSTPRWWRLFPGLGGNGWIGRPGGDLLSRALRHSTMGAGAFHGRVRDGIGCRRPAMTTRSSNPPGTALHG